jgi:hypothetical protein
MRQDRDMAVARSLAAAVIERRKPDGGAEIASSVLWARCAEDEQHARAE